MRNRYNWLQTTEVMMERFETELAYPNPSVLFDDDALRAKVLYDPEYRAQLEKEAARLQAEAVRRTAMVVGRAIRAVFREVFHLLGMVAKGSAAVRLYEDLSRLDDGQLADLGISREQISQYVVDTMEGPSSRTKAASVAALSAIEGGRSERPAKTDLPHRRAA